MTLKELRSLKVGDHVTFAYHAISKIPYGTEGVVIDTDNNMVTADYNGEEFVHEQNPEYVERANPCGREDCSGGLCNSCPYNEPKEPIMSR